MAIDSQKSRVKQIQAMAKKRTLERFKTGVEEAVKERKDYGSLVTAGKLTANGKAFMGVKETVEVKPEVKPEVKK